MLTIKQKSTFLFDCLPSFQEGYLDVGNGHKIYYEQYGNPNGKAVLFLHGGPGACFSSFYKAFFDPKIFRVIFLIKEVLVEVSHMQKLIIIILDLLFQTLKDLEFF